MYNEVLKDTWTQLIENMNTIFKGILIPFLILLCLDLLLPNINPQNITFEVYLVGFISMVAYIYIAITVHRILIMGSSSVSKWGNTGFSSREWSYFIKMLLLGFMIAIPIVLIITLGAALKFDETMISLLILSGIIASVLFSRYSLIFPAIAIDEKFSFSDSWKLTKNYKLLTFVTIVFFPLVLTFVVGGIYGVLIEFLVNGISSSLSILMVPLNVFINVLTIACLSSTYKYIKKENHTFYQPKIKEGTVKEIETIVSDTTIKKIIDVKHNVSFEGLKQDLISQYEPLGFINTVINRANSWMVKNPELGSAYVLLALKENSYTVETYDTEEAKLIILEDNNSLSKV